MDPADATELAQKGGTLVLLGVPEGTYFGIDHQAFVVGPRFKGVKMLPPGTHFVSYRSVSAAGGGCSFTTAFFAFIKPQQVLVRRWDAATETLVPFEDDDEEARFAEGARRFDFDAGLAPYDLRSYAQWVALARFITPPLLDRLSPVAGGNISIMAEADDPELTRPQTEAERRLMEQLTAGRRAQHAARPPSGATEAAAAPATDDSSRAGSQGMEVDGGEGSRPAALPSDGAPSSNAAAAAGAQQGRPAGGRCFYTKVTRLYKPAGASAAELTEWNLDRSMQLDQMIHEQYGDDAHGVLGELQYAFVAFVYGQSLDGYAQWKALLCLLLSCERAAVRSRPDLFADFVQTLHAQLRHTLAPEAPGGGLSSGVQAAPLGTPMVEELLPDSFLHASFAAFFRALYDNDARLSPRMAREAQALKRLLRERLGWDFDLQVLGDAGEELLTVEGDDEQGGEDGPVVVELQPEELQVALAAAAGRPNAGAAASIVG